VTDDNKIVVNVHDPRVIAVPASLLMHATGVGKTWPDVNELINTFSRGEPHSTLNEPPVLAQDNRKPRYRLGYGRRSVSVDELIILAT
jgi:hypothetical protein